MRTQVMQYRASGLSVARYCAEKQLSVHKLYYWIKKTKQIEAANSGDDKFNFIDISTMAIDINADNRTVAPEELSQPKVSLTFPNGLCLKIY